jgi:hypothetical protein
MDEVITLEKVDAIVVPLLALCHTHVCGHHQVSFPTIRFATHIGISLSSFDTSQGMGVHDGFSLVEVMVVKPVTTECISCELTIVAHMTIEIAVSATLEVLSREIEREQGEKERGDKGLHKDNVVILLTRISC